MEASPSNDQDDLGGGAVPESAKRNITKLLAREAWLHRWERRLTYIALSVIGIFYFALLAFIFFGRFRITSGTDYWYFSVATAPHAVAEIPIIIALSTVPTLIMIALLKYFHYRGGKTDASEEDSLPLSASAARALINGISDNKA